MTETWHKKRRRFGLCVRCPAKAESAYCADCYAKVKATQQARLTAHRAAGLCRCGKSTDGHYYCPDCRAKRKIERTELYDMRVRNGLCGACGAPALPGLWACEKHR